MGGKQKLANAQAQANKIASQTARQQAADAAKARRVAVRTAQADRRQAANQNRALVRAERQSAAALASLQDTQDVTTEFITDEEALRKKNGGGMRSAYGFARPMGFGLGGGKTMLG